MKHATKILAAAATVLALSACSPVASQPEGYGPGSGPGWGMMGPGYGPGPGMMGPGYGPGAGMMGQGYGYGPGPGMMGGWGGGFGALPPDLTNEQRTQIGQIANDMRTRQWPLMQQMHALMWGTGGPGTGAFDEQAERHDYDQVAALQKQMFENMLDARKRIDAVLTPQQRDELRRRWSSR